MAEIDLMVLAGQAVAFASTNPEATLGIIGAAIIGMAFTAHQKVWLRNALGNRCAAEEIGMRGEHEGGLEVHHRVPQLYGYEVLGLTEEQVDSPYNAELLCHKHHVGSGRDVIHPDQEEALRDFRRGNKDAFKLLQEMRREKLKHGEEYWDPSWDTRMAAHNTARINEFVWKLRAPYPYHNHRNGNGNH